MNYKLFYQSVAKLKLLSVIFIVLFTLAGLYMHYCLLSANAGERKWKPLSELTGDWYYYMSDIPMKKKDPTEDYILENQKEIIISSGLSSKYPVDPSWK